MVNTFKLTGCAPEPLIHYLKALGILRLIAKQKDFGIRGWWQANTFFISTELTREQLQDFFLKEYSPSPITAPWNGGSGFYGGSAAQYLKQIETSKTQRFESYRRTIKGCRDVIRRLGITRKPDEKQKLEMLAICRSTLPDDAIECTDSFYIMTGESGNKSVNWSQKFAPVFGSGGNDGRLEFTYTFLKYLQLVIPLSDTQKKERNNLAWLEKALFNIGSPVLEKDSVGQFHPGGVGGPNSDRGDKDISLVNPWDYVLAFEGALLFSGAATRRFSYDRYIKPQASFPFSVSASAVGSKTLPTTEVDNGKKNRGEIWLPLWGKATSFKELHYVFTEGRAQLGRKRVVSGLDFARAIVTLGVDRGIYAFQRVGIMAGDRSGKAHLAVSLGNFNVQSRPEVNLLNKLDFWLNQFRFICSNSDTPARYRQELRVIEESMFDYCRYGGALRMQNILIALGSASQSISLLALSKDGFNMKPLMLRSAVCWLEAMDDNSPEFRIAAAVASISGDRDGYVGGIRANIEPVCWDTKKKEYFWEDSNFNVSMSDLSRTLTEVLEKRMVAANKYNLELLPINGKITTSISDVYGYLNGELDEKRILALIKGLVLLDFYEVRNKFQDLSTNLGEFIPTYSLIKLVFLPHPYSWPKGSESVKVRPEQIILFRLRAKDVSGATKIALRRLRSSGFLLKLNTTDTEKLVVSPDVIQRLPGALLIPVYDWRRIADFSLLKPKNIERS